MTLHGGIPSLTQEVWNIRAELPSVMLRTKGHLAQRLESAIHVYKTFTQKVLFSKNLR